MTRPPTALLPLLVVFSPAPAQTAPQRAPSTQPRTSAFYPPHLLERARKNIERDDWGRGIRAKAVEIAEPWRKMADEQLWKLMFGATIPRSWMVWSNGNCPACGKPVPMYDWKIDAINK